MNKIYFSLLFAYFSLPDNPILAQPLCHIYDLVVETLPCNDNGTFGIVFDFQYENVSAAGFDLSINGQPYGFYQYEDLPVTIENFPSNGNPVQYINVSNNDMPDCHDAQEFEVPDCGGGDCHIFDLEADLVPCNDQGLFYVVLNFQHDNTGNEGYNVHGGGVNYGNHPYSEVPLTLGPFEGNGQGLEFVVNDLNHPDCSDFVLVESPDCNGGDCHIFDLVVDVLPCNDNGTFGIVFDFQYENVSAAGFDLSINGQPFGFYQYEDLPVTIENFPSNGNPVQYINVSNNDMPDCHDAQEFEVPNCGGGDCHIFDLEADLVPCNDQGLFYVVLNFQHDNTGNEGYNVHGGGVNYGNHPYSEVPLTLGPFEGNGQGLEFVVNDLNHPDCSDFVLVEAPDCNGGDCHIFDLVVETLPCNDNGNFGIVFDFQYENVSAAGFDLSINGQPFGFYQYEDLPVTIENFPSNGNPVQYINVSNNDMPDCHDAQEFEVPDCEGGDCHINDLFATATACTPDGNFFVTLDFEANNVSGEGFTIHGNGNNYGEFDYDVMPVILGPFPGNGQTLEFVVQDIVHPDCSDFVVLEAPECEQGINCEIGAPEISVFPCDPNGMFFVTVNFDYDNTSLAFNVQGNGNAYGTFAYNTLPLALGPFEGDGETIYELGITDFLFADCHAGGQFGPVECLTGTEEIQPDDMMVVVNGDDISILLSERINSGQVFLYNMAGQCIGSLPVNSHHLQMSTPGLPSGVYLLELRLQEGVIARKLVR